jgi:hypothetical protein
MNKEIVIPVSELKEALPGLSKIVSKKSHLPVLQSVRVARDAEGKVSIMGTDLDAFATYTITEPQAGPVVEFLLPLDQLTKTVKGMKAEGTMTLIPDGKEKVKLWYSIAGNQVRQSVNSLWLHSMNGGIDAVCAFIQHLLQKFTPEAHVSFEWSHDCSKPRVDAYGGGAAFITAEETETMNTSAWLNEQRARLVP